MKIANGVELSRNTKTGPVSATYASQKSCPATCPMLGGGCYGESGRVGIHTARLNVPIASSLEVANAEAEIVGDAAARFMARRRPTDAWTYAHAWETIKRASWGAMSVLASCHTKDEVKRAMSRGYAASIVTADMPDKAFKEDGITYVPCLEQTKGITCVECRLCFDDSALLAKKIVIVFKLHTAAKKAYGALARAYKSWGL